jgi:hypothetical protein
LSLSRTPAAVCSCWVTRRIPRLTGTWPLVCSPGSRDVQRQGHSTDIRQISLCSCNVSTVAKRSALVCQNW